MGPFAKVSEPGDLETARRLLVEIGEAPDGLPWLLNVDRSDQIDTLRSNILGAFGARDVNELPASLRQVIDNELIGGLFGIHSVRADDGQSRRLFVSRRSAKYLLGPTLLGRILEPDTTRIVHSPSTYANTAAVAAGSPSASATDAIHLARVEQAVQQMRTIRHLAVDCTLGAPLIVAVTPEHQALRQPSPPLRPLRMESLASLKGATAVIGSDDRVPIGDQRALIEHLELFAGSGAHHYLYYEVPAAAVVDLLADVARLIGQIHATGRLHGDLSPGNILACRDGAQLIDSLSPAQGEVLGLATFRWASPEQILGKPSDARTDVFAVGKMLAALVGGVPFGEETTHVIPTGGRAYQKVQVLRCEGVYIDILGTNRSRQWQIAWSDLLSSAMHRDPERRPRDGLALAEQISRLAAEHPVDGKIALHCDFGRLAFVELKGNRVLARILDDWALRRAMFDD